MMSYVTTLAFPDDEYIKKIICGNKKNSELYLKLSKKLYKKK
tara:strand:- start:159 stop:284 length:126 start_codon:yes stop_codon:yes gene_type:complete